MARHIAFSSSTIATNLRSLTVLTLPLTQWTRIACIHRFAIGLQSYANPAKGRMMLVPKPSHSRHSRDL
jgi:hypothetical protein